MKLPSLLLAVVFFAPNASAALCGIFPAHEEYLKLSARGMRMSTDPHLVVVDMLNTDTRTAVSGAWNLGVLAVASANFRPPVALKFSDAEYPTTTSPHAT